MFNNNFCNTVTSYRERSAVDDYSNTGKNKFTSACIVYKK